MRRTLPNPAFSRVFHFPPGEFIELRHVLLCHIFWKQITTILVTKTKVLKNKITFHKNEMTFYLL